MSHQIHAAFANQSSWSMSDLIAKIRREIASIGQVRILIRRPLTTYNYFPCAGRWDIYTGGTKQQVRNAPGSFRPVISQLDRLLRDTFFETLTIEYKNGEKFHIVSAQLSDGFF